MIIEHLITGWTVVLFVGMGVVGYLAFKAGQLYERRESERRSPVVPSRAAELTEGEPGLRMQRLEQAVDSIAVELERLGEGQRFVAKLLVERKGETEKALRSPQPNSVPASPRPTA
jgi:hypothetical protein